MVSPPLPLQGDHCHQCKIPPACRRTYPHHPSPRQDHSGEARSPYIILQPRSPPRYPPTPEARPWTERDTHALVLCKLQASLCMRSDEELAALMPRRTWQSVRDYRLMPQCAEAMRRELGTRRGKDVSPLLRTSSLCGPSPDTPPTVIVPGPFAKSIIAEVTRTLAPQTLFHQQSSTRGGPSRN